MSVPIDDAPAVFDGVSELLVENLTLGVRREVELERKNKKIKEKSTTGKTPRARQKGRWRGGFPVEIEKRADE